MEPWLITTSGWPALTAHVAGATARAVVDPAVVGGALGAVALAAALLGLGRARERPGGGST